jgi:hypothetical protein
MNDFACKHCKQRYTVDEDTHMPMLLICGHPLCKKCVELFIKKKINKCPHCDRDVQISKKPLKEYIPHNLVIDQMHKVDESEHSSGTMQSEESQSQSRESETVTSISDSNKEKMNMSQQGDRCNKHREKNIEYFCQSCTQAVCVICIYQSHNGHHLTVLEEMSNIIKQNIADFSKMLKNLHKVNDENTSTANQRLEELDKLKDNQLSIVKKVFDEVNKKLDDKKAELLKEFLMKYDLEEKRFNKLQTLLRNSLLETDKINNINRQLEVFAENQTDAKILKKIEDFTMFLHKSFIDIKRLYKTEISLKAELKIDRAMLPVNINTKNLLMIIDKIDAKVICYPESIAVKEDETDATGKSMRDSQSEHGFIQNLGKDKKSNLHPIHPNKRHIVHLKKLSSQNSEITNSEKALEHDFNEFSNKLNNMDNNYRRDLMPQKSLVSIPKPKVQKRGQNSQGQMGRNHFNTYERNDGKIQNYSANRKKGYNSESESNSQGNNQYNTYSPKNRPNTGKNNNSQSKGGNYLPKLKNNRRQSHSPPNVDNLADMHAIICIGDTNMVLKYYLEDNYWQAIQIDEKKSNFHGGIRYSSLCVIPGQKLFLSGGCMSMTEEAVNSCYEISSSNISINTKMPSMSYKRYAHCSVFVNGFIYILGGFNHKDDNKSSPSTLSHCERFDLKTHKWQPIKPMNHARAFFGCANINSEHIFAFGGFFDHQILQSIEKYDTLSETWTTYFLKLKDKLAKMGIVTYQNNIIILGGINSSYDVVPNAWVLDTVNANWQKLPEMLYPRSFNQSALLFGNYIYAIGGNVDCNCERFDFYHNKWQLIESYTTALKTKRLNELYNFAFSTNFIGDS